ncbi:hypothetical protein BS17DRAFT_137866 [Gyrodon lividus]|nr:hypothetical protein BS17DRAFT_137866 [Gyrodon lividus]
MHHARHNVTWLSTGLLAIMAATRPHDHRSQHDSDPTSSLLLQPESRFPLVQFMCFLLLSILRTSIGKGGITVPSGLCMARRVPSKQL